MKEKFIMKENWKFVCDGEKPNKYEMLLLLRRSVNGLQALIGYYSNDRFESFNEKSGYMESIDSVYAWQVIEMVLPKDSEVEK